jgi:hypothetical protein
MLLLIGPLASDKPAAAGKPSACYGAYKERLIRSNASPRKLLHPILDVPDQHVLEYYSAMVEQMVAGNTSSCFGNHDHCCC